MSTSNIISIIALCVAVFSFFISLRKSKKTSTSEKILSERAKQLVKQNEWSMSQEREFFENLYSQRVNLYIVIYSAVVTGILAAKEKEDKILVYSLGIYLTMIAGISLYRACHKLHLILQLLHKADGHPVKEVGDLARDKPWPLSFAVNHLTGIWMPLLSFFVLVVWFVIYVFKG